MNEWTQVRKTGPRGNSRYSRFAGRLVFIISPREIHMPMGAYEQLGKPNFLALMLNPRQTHFAMCATRDDDPNGYACQVGGQHTNKSTAKGLVRVSCRVFIAANKLSVENAKAVYVVTHEDGMLVCDMRQKPELI